MEMVHLQRILEKKIMLQNLKNAERISNVVVREGIFEMSI